MILTSSCCCYVGAMSYALYFYLKKFGMLQRKKSSVDFSLLVGMVVREPMTR